MKVRLLGCLLLAAALSGCFFEEYSRVESVKGSGNQTGNASVAMDDNFALVGRQLIERRGNYWIKGPLLPAASSGWSNENVDINGGFAVVANAFYNEVTVFKYEKATSSWVEDAFIKEPTLQTFGQSVAVSATHLVIGAPISSTAVIYRREQDQWVKQQSIVAEAGSRSLFGNSVVLNGKQLVVSDNEREQVFVYQLKDKKSELIQTISNPSASDDSTQFGWAMSASKTWVAISAYTDETNGSNGRVHLYRVEDGQLIYKQSVSAFANNGEVFSGGVFGHSIALNNRNLIVGDDDNDVMYHFSRSGDNWSGMQMLTHPDSEVSDLGYHVGMNRHYILAGNSEKSSALLLGPSVPTALLSGQVVDANGTIIKQVSVDGFLSPILTDDQGRFETDLPLGWHGEVFAFDSDVVSDPVSVLLTKDTDVGEFVLDFVPELRLLVRVNGQRVNGVELQITGREPLIMRGRIANLTLPNGWKGKVVPVKAGYRFEPSSFETDSLLDNRMRIDFEAIKEPSVK